MKKFITLVLSVLMCFLFNVGCAAVTLPEDTNTTTHQCYSNQWAIVQEPTEQDEGLMQAICADCGNTKIVILPRLDDVNYKLDKKVEVCTQGGIYIYTYYIPTQYIPNDYQWAQIVADAHKNDIEIDDSYRQIYIEIVITIKGHSHYIGNTALEDYYTEPLLTGVKKDGEDYYLNPDLIVDENGIPMIVEYADNIATNTTYGKGYFKCSECKHDVIVDTYREG